MAQVVPHGRTFALVGTAPATIDGGTATIGYTTPTADGGTAFLIPDAGIDGNMGDIVLGGRDSGLTFAPPILGGRTFAKVLTSGLTLAPAGVSGLTLAPSQ